jgi:predicted esterase YcpF (UPF0227 family)
MNDIKKVIKYFQSAINEISEAIGTGGSPEFDASLCEQSGYYATALEALREKAMRENPKPLSLDELKERVGKPVYMHGKWHIVKAVISHFRDYRIEDESGALYRFGTTNFYANEPKEAR